jgi:hypothetical protein
LGPVKNWQEVFDETGRYWWFMWWGLHLNGKISSIADLKVTGRLPKVSGLVG